MTPRNHDPNVQLGRPFPFEWTLPYDDYSFSRRLYELVHDWGIPTETEISFLEQYINKPGARIFDMACGGGRHALALAERGHEVAAVDIGPYPIDLAGERARAKNLQINLHCENILNTAFQNEFDLAYLICGQMGHFSPADNQRIFTLAFRALKENGIFIIHLSRLEDGDRHNRTMWYREKSPLYFEQESLVHREQYYFAEERVKTVRDFAINSVTRDFRWFGISEKEYGPEEMTTMAERSGFATGELFGGYGHESYDPKGTALIMVFSKESRN
ncbi:hypothetical protein TRIP_C20805 [Candidatus Zixiibacteriota bacterium]|nr:hypothetical protein TRIP_C20805 [candidate division Zixibacteria bacterium]